MNLPLAAYLTPNKTLSMNLWHCFSRPIPCLISYCSLYLIFFKSFIFFESFLVSYSTTHRHFVTRISWFTGSWVGLAAHVGLCAFSSVFRNPCQSVTTTFVFSSQLISSYVFLFPFNQKFMTTTQVEFFAWLDQSQDLLVLWLTSLSRISCYGVLKLLWYILKLG